MIRPRPCLICGRRVESGESRCEAHKVGGRRLQPCLVCARPSQGRYCEVHEPTVDEAVRNARNPYRRHYKSAEYARNRQHRYERARGRCEDCARPVGPGEWECDHVVPVRLGGTNDLDNLRVRCIVPRDGAPKGCHGLKTRQDRRK